MAKEYHIFISHSWSYPDDLESLRKLLRERGYFNVEFEEASANEPIDSEQDVRWNTESIVSAIRYWAE